MNVDNLSKAIQIELEKYSQEFTEKIKKDTENIAEECVDELKKTSPSSNLSGSKKYAKGWKYKKVFENECGIRFRVLNKNKPQLTHLLEFGHAKVNGGRVEAKPHIKKAEEKAKEKLINLIKEN